MRLLDAYEQYYLSPRDNRESLHRHLVNYDFSDFDAFYKDVVEILVDVRDDHTDTVRMLSNGSRGGNRTIYYMAPGYWIGKVENHLKRQDGLDTVFITESWNRDVITESGEDLYRYYFHLHVTPEGDNLGDLCDFLWQNRPLHLRARPHLFLYVMGQKWFVDHLIDNKKMIASVVTTDWNPFFKKQRLIDAGIWVNDNMINWITGINFYTCPKNHKHFLPIFRATRGGSRCVNLLNVGRMMSRGNDDFFRYDSVPVRCECGRPRLNFKVVTHTDNLITSPDGRVVCDDTLPERLEDSYLSLQFIKDRKSPVVKCAYALPGGGDMSDADRDVIHAFFRDFEMEVTFHSNTFVRNGFGKFFPFWCGDGLLLGPYPHAKRLTLL